MGSGGPVGRSGGSQVLRGQLMKLVEIIHSNGGGRDSRGPLSLRGIVGLGHENLHVLKHLDLRSRSL